VDDHPEPDQGVRSYQRPAALNHQVVVHRYTLEKAPLHSRQTPTARGRKRLAGCARDDAAEASRRWSGHFVTSDKAAYRKQPRPGNQMRPWVRFVSRCFPMAGAPVLELGCPLSLMGGNSGLRADLGLIPRTAKRATRYPSGTPRRRCGRKRHRPVSCLGDIVFPRIKVIQWNPSLRAA
jgi:hypothetical protein